ncbi:MAG: magnesium transporter [Candidatus Loosdrechtia sp.]|uniref:magnesium transporter n=1 Tax=Candidatus Loosdrechtia sp. TaxID=3101272 RepID=UPI003A5E3E74|nr:MAG: magnesium transporter [Candidatus Jettenia sp. AMX2]
MLFRNKTIEKHSKFRYSTEIFAVCKDHTAQDAIEQIRNNELSGNIFYCYAVDDEGRLTGIVPLRKLITAPPETKISQIMIHNPIRLATQTPIDTALEYFVTYKFLAFPVVDEQGMLVGIARANDFLGDTIAIEEELEQARDDLLKIIGVKLEEFRKPTVFKSAFLRFPYLLFNIISGITCAFITSAFSHTINKFVFVAFFITIILGLAESMGTQAVAVALSSLGKTIKMKGLVLYEILVGTKIGALCGALMYIVSFLWLREQAFSITLSLTILFTLITASFLGVSLPIFFKKLGINPTHASSPLVLAISDIISLTSYFLLGTHLLNRFA